MIMRMMAVDQWREKLDKQLYSHKKLLEKKAQTHDYDFLHPEVIRTSERLDVLIVRYLKANAKNSVNTGKLRIQS